MKLSQKGLLLVVAALAGVNAQAAGLEKATTWGAKYEGAGGTSVSYASGAESLYFNPAGLAVKTGENGDVSLNFSPTFTSTSGPFTPGTISDSSGGFIPVGSGMVSYHPMEKLGIAAGWYVSGGAKSEYDGVNFGTGFNPDIKTNLALTEFSVGAGYEVMPGFRVGASWRIVHVGGDFDIANPAGGVYIANDSIGQTKYNAFKVGAQYDSLDKMWGVGVTFRNGVTFNADDTQTVRLLSSGTQVSSGAGTIGTTFPWQLTVGGNYSIMDTLRLHLEYALTDYSIDQGINIYGTGANPVNSVLAAHWKDMQNYKIGFEYTGLGAYTLRAGYIYTTQVTPDGTAYPSFFAPANGNTITLGAGTWVMNKAIELNLGLEYSFVNGNDIPGSSTVVAGDYKSHDFGVHLSGDWRF